MLEFNVPGGKLNRGMAVLDVLKAIKGTEVGLQTIPPAFTRHPAYILLGTQHVHLCAAAGQQRRGISCECFGLVH